MTLEKAPAFRIGDRLLDYELVGVLGQGGHATVFHGRDARAGRDVAIKVIQKRKDDLQLRGQAEGRLLVTIEHPNVVEVFKSGVLEDGRVYIVMEKLPGLSLREVKTRLQRLSVVEALLVGMQVASGVLAAHARKVIHRDLKPDNIFILPGNAAKVLDFGIAKYLEQSFDTTQKRTWQGTPDYMAPEQFKGLPVSFRSDVFALGITLYELIAGVKPSHIGGVPTSVEQFAVRQFAVVPPLLHELDEAIPRGTSRLIQRAIAKWAKDRFDMQEFLERMRVEHGKLVKRGFLPRDLLASCANSTLPDTGPEFTAISRRTTLAHAPVQTGQVTLAGIAPRDGLGLDLASPSQPRSTLEWFDESSPAAVTRTATLDEPQQNDSSTDSMVAVEALQPAPSEARGFLDGIGMVRKVGRNARLGRFLGVLVAGAVGTLVAVEVGLLGFRALAKGASAPELSADRRSSPAARTTSIPRIPATSTGSADAAFEALPATQVPSAIAEAQSIRVVRASRVESKRVPARTKNAPEVAAQLLPARVDSGLAEAPIEGAPSESKREEGPWTKPFAPLIEDEEESSDQPARGEEPKGP